MISENLYNNLIRNILEDLKERYLSTCYDEHDVIDVRYGFLGGTNEFYDKNNKMFHVETCCYAAKIKNDNNGIYIINENTLFDWLKKMFDDFKKYKEYSKIAIYFEDSYEENGELLIYIGYCLYDKIELKPIEPTFIDK